MDMIFSWDRALFLQINQLHHSVVTDSIAMFFSGIGELGAVWLLIAVLVFIREELRDHWFFAPIASAMAVGLVLSEFALKHIVARPRPAAEMGAIIVSAAENYSFPSTHAILAFAGAYVLSSKEPKYRTSLYLLAAAIALSRIYLGAHYPVDVLGGALIGSVIGYYAVRIENALLKLNNGKRIKRKKT